MYIEYRPCQDVSTLVKLMRRSLRKLQVEFTDLKKNIGSSFLGNRVLDVGVSGNITDEMVNQYLEHHRNPNENNNDNFYN